MNSLLRSPFRLLLPAAILLFVPVSSAHAQTSDVARQKAALQNACNSGALSADECKQRMAALNNSGSSSGSASKASGGAYTAETGGLANAQTWKEPNGRYSISIPSGWKVDTSAGNLKITNGDSWAIFDTKSQPGEPLDVAKSTADAMAPMVSDWQVFNQGPFTTARHHPAAGMTVGCTVATRSGPTKRVMLFSVLGAGNQNYVVMTSSADAATGRPINGLLMQVFESIRFSGE
jgi:hypothetical protein